MLLKLHTKLAPGWALIQVNFDPIQEIGPKVGGGRSFARLWYKLCVKWSITAKYCSCRAVETVIGQLTGETARCYVLTTLK